MPAKLPLAFAIGLTFLSVTAEAQKTINVPSVNTPTIQSGINAASSGDTVLVAPGTYQENLTITGTEITLTSSGGAAQTTIDGQGVGSVITITGTPSLKTTISGFTIIHGTSGSSGSTAGIELTNAGATILDNSFSANSDAVSVNYGSVSVVDNQISTLISAGTFCSTGSGIRLYGNSVISNGSGGQAPTVISGNTISATGKCTGGVGILAQQGSDLTIENNQISGQALGINTFPTTGRILILNNLITGNTTGGLYIIQQTATPAADPATTFVINNTFANNLSGAKGLTSGSVGPAELYVNGTFSKVAVLNNIFSTSSATNPILDCFGAPSSAGNPITPIILDHNLFWNPAGKLGLDGCPVTAGVFGNINVNPQFVSTTNFSLAAGSPAIDAGNNSVGFDTPQLADLAGNLRLQNATGLSEPIVDMGAYEFAGATTGSPSYLNVTSTSYYLTTGNAFTLTAQLSNNQSRSGGSTVFPAAQPVTFSGTGLAPVTVNTDANGMASVPYTLANPGLYAFTVSYAGGSYPAATSVVLYVYITNPLAVTTLTLASSQNPSLVGQSVTFTVTSNATDGSHPTPIVLADNGTTLASLTIPASGSTTYKTSTLALGSHPLTVSYPGDSTHTTGSAGLTQLVGNYPATATTLASTINPSIFNQTITLSAHVSSGSGVPAGSVTFSDSGTPLGAAVAVDGSGNASFTTYTLAVGSHALTAAFTPSGLYLGSTGSLTQVVNLDPTASSLTVTPTSAVSGANVTLTATVVAVAPATGTPTGAVTFYDGTTNLGTVTLSGSGTAGLTTTFLAGTHSLSCVYNGSSVYATSNCQAASIVIAAAPTQLSLASATNPSPALTPINFTAQLSINGQAAGAGNTIVLSGVQTTPVTLTTGSNGSVSYTAAGFVPGQYPISASFAATANQLASSASLSETVNANPTITTLSATPSPGLQHSPVVLAATVTATVGAAATVGTVSFFDGATLLAAMPVVTSGGTSSTANYTTSALSPGSHTLSAVYTPTAASFLASQSAPLALTILPQDFTLSANPPSITIETQHHASMSLSLVSTGGFTAPITLTCGTLPAYVTCELPTTPVLLGSDQTVTVSLNLDTDAILNFSQATPPSRSRLAEGVVLAALCPLLLIGRRRRRLLRSIAMLAVIAALAGTLTACSSKYPGHTLPGVYVIPITATGTAVGNSSPTTHELDITLTVTQ